MFDILLDMDLSPPGVSRLLLDSDGRLAVDLHCAKCEYNLRGLSPVGSCPECELVITVSIEFRGRRLRREWAELIFIALAISLLFPVMATRPFFHFLAVFALLPLGVLVPLVIFPLLTITFYRQLWKSLTISPWLDLAASAVPGFVSRRAFFQWMLILFIVLEVVRACSWLLGSVSFLVGTSSSSKVADAVVLYASPLAPLFNLAMLGYIASAVQFALSRRALFIVTWVAVGTLAFDEVVRVVSLMPNTAKAELEYASISTTVVIWLLEGYLIYKVVRSVRPHSALP